MRFSPSRSSRRPVSNLQVERLESRGLLSTMIPLNDRDTFFGLAPAANLEQRDIVVPWPVRFNEG
jgi:hypothetical protein